MNSYNELFNEMCIKVIIVRKYNKFNYNFIIIKEKVLGMKMSNLP